jgi:hypothetical protein
MSALATVTTTLQSIARRARLASVAQEPLELILSPEESATLADVLTAALEDDQSWYWSEEWQAGERAAEADLVAGRGQVFDTMEGFLQDLGLDLDEVDRV